MATMVSVYKRVDGFIYLTRYNKTTMGVGIVGPPYVKLYNPELDELVWNIKELLSLPIEIVPDSTTFDTSNHPLFAKLADCKDWSAFAKGTISISISAVDGIITFMRKKRDRGGFSSAYDVSQAGTPEELEQLSEIIPEIEHFLRDS